MAGRVGFLLEFVGSPSASIGLSALNWAGLAETVWKMAFNGEEKGQEGRHVRRTVRLSHGTLRELTMAFRPRVIAHTKPDEL